MHGGAFPYGGIYEKGICGGIFEIVFVDLNF